MSFGAHTRTCRGAVIVICESTAVAAAVAVAAICDNTAAAVAAAARRKSVYANI